jgi:hypothetical protein
MTFEEAKKRKLKNSFWLRLMNYVGMVYWHKDISEDAKQKLRLLHPFTWVWVPVVYFVIFLVCGVVEATKDLKEFWLEETVWW